MIDLVLYYCKRPFHLIKTGLLNGLPAQVRFHQPQKKLTIIGVTGTDGKTTTASLIHHLLEQSGLKVGLITTVSAKIGSKSIDTGFHVTSPPPSLLYQTLADMVTAGCTHVVLEITSHGSYQYRNWGIRPQLGLITNIAHEHLDYHVTFLEYVKAKCAIFRHTPTVLVASTDPALPKIKRFLTRQQLELVPIPRVVSPRIREAIKKRFAEKHNRYNATMAATAALKLGGSESDCIKGILSFSGIPGRMEQIPNRKRLKLIVDFAHTPQAVASVLRSVQSGSRGSVIVVLGSAGLRDTAKRPQMGRLAAQLADLAIFTSEDPRIENPWSIINQMKSDLGHYHNKVISIVDRGEAIFAAITQYAKAGDTVLVLGKGHEQSMCYGTTEYDWSDQDAIRSVLQTGTVPKLGKALHSA